MYLASIVLQAMAKHINRFLTFITSILFFVPENVAAFGLSYVSTLSNRIHISDRAYATSSRQHSGIRLNSGFCKPIPHISRRTGAFLAQASMIFDTREVVFKISSDLEVKALEVKGWGWTGNENGYGLVIWPGARSVAKVLAKQLDLITVGTNVVELGAGSGLCSLVCAAKGATVVATDLNLEPLSLAKEAAEKQGLLLTTLQFDILGSEPLPPCDLLVVADCIYTPDLGRGVARRVLEAKERGGTAIVGSSVNRPGYAVFKEEMSRVGFGNVRAEKVVDFSSPLWLLDAVRGNYVQEVSIF